MDSGKLSFKLPKIFGIENQNSPNPLKITTDKNQATFTGGDPVVKPNHNGSQLEVGTFTPGAEVKRTNIDFKKNLVFNDTEGSNRGDIDLVKDQTATLNQGKADADHFKFNLKDDATVEIKSAEEGEKFSARDSVSIFGQKGKLELENYDPTKSVIDINGKIFNPGKIDGKASFEISDGYIKGYEAIESRGSLSSETKEIWKNSGATELQEHASDFYRDNEYYDQRNGFKGEGLSVDGKEIE